MWRAIAVLLLCFAGAAAGSVAAQQVPWPPWVRSVMVADDGVVVHSAPSENSPRRGTVREGTRLAVEGRTTGLGCGNARFVRVGTDAYVCERDLRLSPEPPHGDPLPALKADALLPHDYMFVISDGTPGYVRPADYLTDEYEQALGEDFGLVVTERRLFEGVPFVRAAAQLYVAEESLRVPAQVRFAGRVLGQGEALDHAWVTRSSTTVRARPRGEVLRKVPHHGLLRIAGPGPGGTWQLVDGGYVTSSHVTRARPAPPPAGLGPRERWIDVDVDNQVMVAYEGPRPVYTTLVSTGVKGRGTETPRGQFRIWVKLATSNMNDTERVDVDHNYSIEEVPWVQYFEDGFGFHAAFWHEGFGSRRSRGCVNLSPRDARWLFDWTGPGLPPGWYAVLPTDRDRGTLVVVR